MPSFRPGSDPWLPHIGDVQNMTEEMFDPALIEQILGYKIIRVVTRNGKKMFVLKTRFGSPKIVPVSYVNKIVGERLREGIGRLKNIVDKTISGLEGNESERIRQIRRAFKDHWRNALKRKKVSRKGVNTTKGGEQILEPKVPEEYAEAVEKCWQMFRKELIRRGAIRPNSTQTGPKKPIKPTPIRRK